MTANITELRERYPHLSPGFLDLMAERAELKEVLNELRDTVAQLAGGYGYLAKASGNAELANLVRDLRVAIARTFRPFSEQDGGEVA
jgi:glutamine synthetase adenylyltransferase